MKKYLQTLVSWLGFLFLITLSLIAMVWLISQTRVAHAESSAQGVFIFNPRTLQWRAINAAGVVVREGRGSAGRGYCPDIHRSCHTPVGTFHVLSKGGADCHSSRYPVGRGGAPMPYCMFFSNNYAVHGSPDVPNYNASHGCIRVRPSDAHWLNYNFMKIGTTVIIKPY